MIYGTDKLRGRRERLRLEGEIKNELQRKNDGPLFIIAKYNLLGLHVSLRRATGTHFLPLYLFIPP